MSDVTSSPWGTISASDYKDGAAYCGACLINRNDGPPASWTKDACSLPVRQPDGALNTNAMSAAAGILNGARGGVDASDAEKKTAARTLIGFYRDAKLNPPSSLTALAGTGTSGPMDQAIRARAGFAS